MAASAALVAISSLALVAPASAAVTRPLNGDLVGTFAFGGCPAGSPAGALCLHDSVAGPISELGRSTGEFDVLINTAASGPDGCAPADKRGFFVAENGNRVEVTAHGSYCLATSTANYAFTVTGGSGRFAGATGTGSWLVPPPSSLSGTGGVGDERLRGTITYDQDQAAIAQKSCKKKRSHKKKNRSRKKGKKCKKKPGRRK
jgi:hypothetical protein